MNDSAFHKRIQIVGRNIGLEQTDQARRTLEIEFRDKTLYEIAMRTLSIGLKNALQQSVILENESGVVLGFNPHHYSYHFVDDVANWPTTWNWLPNNGEPPPDRENF